MTKKDCNTVWKAGIQNYFAEKTGHTPGTGMTAKLFDR
jgi:hypothetical protein